MNTMIAFLLIPLFTLAQEEMKGVAVFVGGDSLEGVFRYEKERLFRGLEYQGEEGGSHFIPSDSLKSFSSVDGTQYRSVRIPKAASGVDAHSLLLLRIDGPMKLLTGRYRFKSCTCQDLPSIREGAVLLKEGEEQVHLVKKNRLLDRIKNADRIASAFLPYDNIMEKVRDRDYAYSEIGQAVERFNERSQTSNGP